MGVSTTEVTAGVIHGLLRYVDEEWGDRYARWRLRRLKKKLDKLKKIIKEHDESCSGKV